MIQMTEENELLFPEGTYILCKEPLPHADVDNIRKILREGVTVQELAACYAAVSNQAAWTEDDIYDYESGTEDYRKLARLQTNGPLWHMTLRSYCSPWPGTTGFFPRGKWDFRKNWNRL